MRRIGSTVKVAAAMALASALAAGGAVTAATPAVASGSPALVAATWHVVKTVPGPNFPAFLAATASSGTSAWAFEAAGNDAAPRAYQLGGKTWRVRNFPAKKGDEITGASSSSPSNVWAFGVSSKAAGEAVRFNGHSWNVVKTFTQPINSGLAISPTDTWVFGEAFAPSLGTLHYDGHTWTKVKTGTGLLGASALSASSIWAYGSSGVGLWNGHTWKRTSVTRLLPKSSKICGPGFLSAIDAISATNVYAAGAAGCQDGQGPLVLLHYNGKGWGRVAGKQHIAGDPVGLISDDLGGLWIPMATGDPTSSFMERYSSGKLSQVTLPVSKLHLALIGATIGADTTAALAFGLTRTSISARTSTAVILQFGS